MLFAPSVTQDTAAVPFITDSQTLRLTILVAKDCTFVSLSGCYADITALSASALIVACFFSGDNWHAQTKDGFAYVNQ